MNTSNLKKMADRRFKTRGLKKDTLIPGTNDDLHRSIELCPVSKELMSCPHVQRMKSLKQLGTSNNTYMSTNHTRFEHSLGVAWLAEQTLVHLQKQQPRLGITKKDILCVNLAGLLHDLGHGPFSHVYDGVFRKQLKHAELKGEWLGQPFDVSMYADIDHQDMPETMKGWSHEDASLMMIDGMLKHLGLEIDESNLDAPLRQIGDGVDAKVFGLWDRSKEPVIGGDDSDSESDDEDSSYHPLEPLPLDEVLTSRDWIFIKECIMGGPLPPKGVSMDSFKDSSQNAELIGRPDNHKEFLYDLVSNRHSGLDVDKMDYLARDSMRAFGTSAIADVLPKLISKSCVAWGECNPSACWKCRNGDGPGKHLMICYPENMTQNMMSFFEQRYKEHQRLYTHSKTQRVNYMVCDIFLLAEPHFRLCIINDDAEDEVNDSAVQRVPISRAMINDSSYMELTDGVLDKILNDPNPALRPARSLIKRLRDHEKLYKDCGKEIIFDKPVSWQRKLSGMSESEVIDELLKLDELDLDDGLALDRNDIIVDINKIHHGMKDQNPVNSVRFLDKNRRCRLLNPPELLPTAKQISDSSYRTPSFYIQRTIRVFCRSLNSEKQHRLTECFKNLVENLKTEESCTNIQFEPIGVSLSSPTKNVLEVPAVSQSPTQDSPQRANKRQRSLFDTVVGNN